MGKEFKIYKKKCLINIYLQHIKKPDLWKHHAINFRLYLLYLQNKMLTPQRDLDATIHPLVYEMIVFMQNEY